jgi:hypothetical protein
MEQYAKYVDTEVEVKLLDDNVGQIEGVPENPATVTQARYETCRDVMAKSDDTMLQLRQVVVYPLNGRYVIVSGHTRVRACRELGKEIIPVRILDPATPAEYIAELAIKSNVDYGEFDISAMKADYDMRTILDCGLDPSLFTFEFDKTDYHGDFDDFGGDDKINEAVGEPVTDVPEDRFGDLPDELDGVDLAPEPLEKVSGTDERFNERIVVSYHPDQKSILEDIIGVEIDKVVFHITELKQPVSYMEFEE